MIFTRLQILQNLDLLSVGITIAAITILGFIILFRKPNNSTHTAFFFLTMMAALWSVLNYTFYQFYTPLTSLWILRFVLFFAVWYAFSFFRLTYIFPAEQITFPKAYFILSGFIPIRLFD